MNSHHFWTEMANTYLKFGAHQDAIVAYTRAIESLSQPVEQADLWCKIGDIHLVCNDLSAAVSAYRAAFELDPEGHDFAATLDRIPRAGQFDQATIDSVKQMLDIKPNEDSGGLAAEIESEPLPAESAPAEPTPEPDAPQAETAAPEAAPILEVEPAEAPVLEAVGEQDELPAPAGDEPTPEAAPEAIAGEVIPALAAEPALVAEALPAAESAVETIVPPADAPETEPAPVAEPLAEIPAETLIELAIENIITDPQPLRAAQNLEDLVESVREHGIIHPLLVSPDAEPGKYFLISGQRRLAAARQLGLPTVPAVVRSASGQQRIELWLVENAQRADLNPLELAEAFRRLQDHFDMDPASIGKGVGKPAVYVEQSLRLLRLTNAAKDALGQKVISEGHAQSLLEIEVPEMQESVLAFVIESNLSVRQTEDLVRRLVAPQPAYTPADMEAPLAVEGEPEVSAEAATAELPAGAEIEPPVSEAPAVYAPIEPAADAPEAVSEPVEIPAEPVAEVVDTVPEPAFEAPEAVVEEVDIPAEPAAEDLAVLPESNEDAAIPAPVEVVSEAAVTAPVAEMQPQAALAEVAVAEPVVETPTDTLPDEVIEQLWNNALEEMVVTVCEPEAVVDETPLAETEAVVEILPVSMAGGAFDETRFKAMQGISIYERVTADSPENDRAWHTLGQYYSEVGQFDKAIEALNRAVSIDATKDIYFFHLGQAYAATRSYLDAIRSFERTVAINPQHVFAHCSLAGYYRKLGNGAEAIKHIEIALPNIRQEKAYNQACFEAICGNTDRALEMLKTSLRVDQVPLEWLQRDPDLDFIREDARFQALVTEYEVLLTLRAHQQQ